VTENPWAGQGAVLLDIGGDVGALVVHMPASMTGVEVEARIQDGPERPVHHPHVAVVERPVGADLVPSLVFPSLTEGRYQLVRKGSDGAELTVAVAGGEVTWAEWPGVTPAGDASAPSAVPGEDG
jgi:hypothetical protein